MPQSESEPGFLATGLTLRVGEPEGRWNPPLCLGTRGWKGVTEPQTLTWSRAAGLAVLSLSTDTRRGCRLWKSSSPLGPGPSCTQSRPSTAAASACSSPFPGEMLSGQPMQQGSAPSQFRSPLSPQGPTFLEALFQGISQGEAALQQEVGE